MSLGPCHKTGAYVVVYLLLCSHLAQAYEPVAAVRAGRSTEDMVRELMSRVDALEASHRAELKQLHDKHADDRAAWAASSGSAGGPVALRQAWREFRERNPNMSAHHHDLLLMQLGSGVSAESLTRFVFAGGIVVAMGLVMVARMVADYVSQYTELEDNLSRLSGDLTDLTLSLKCNTQVTYYKLASSMMVHRQLILEARAAMNLNDKDKCVSELLAACEADGYVDGIRRANAHTPDDTSDESMTELERLRREVEEMRQQFDDAQADRMDLPGGEGNMKAMCGHAPGDSEGWRRRLEERCANLDSEIDQVLGLITSSLQRTKEETLEVCRDLRELRNEYYPGKVQGEGVKGTVHVWDTSLEEGLIENIAEDAKRAMGVAVPALSVMADLDGKRLEDLADQEQWDLDHKAESLGEFARMNEPGELYEASQEYAYEPETEGDGGQATTGMAVGGASMAGMPAIELGTIVGAMAPVVGAALEIANYFHTYRLTNQKDYVYNAALTQQCEHLMELSGKIAHHQILFQSAEGLFLSMSQQQSNWAAEKMHIPPDFRRMFRHAFYKHLGDDVFLKSGHASYCEREGATVGVQGTMCHMAVMFARYYMDPEMRPFDLQMAFEARTWPVLVMGLLRMLKGRLNTFSNSVEETMREKGCDNLLYIQQARFERSIIHAESSKGSLFPQTLALTEEGQLQSEGRSKSDADANAREEILPSSPYSHEFADTYQVMLNIKSARDLAPMDTNGLSDPYAVVYQGYPVKNNSKYRWKKLGRSSVVQESLDPAWKLDLSATAMDPKQSIIRVCVYDRDNGVFADDVHGCVILDFHALGKGISPDAWSQYRPKELMSFIQSDYLDAPLRKWNGKKKFIPGKELPECDDCGTVNLSWKLYREREPVPPTCQIADIMTCVAVVQSWFCPAGTQWAPGSGANRLMSTIAKFLPEDSAQSTLSQLDTDATPHDVFSAAYEDHLRQSATGLMADGLALSSGGSGSGLMEKIIGSMNARMQTTEMNLLRRRFKNDKKIGLEMGTDGLVTDLDSDGEIEMGAGKREAKNAKKDLSEHLDMRAKAFENLNKSYMMTSMLYNLKSGDDINPGSQVFRKRIVPLAGACADFLLHTDSATRVVTNRRRQKQANGAGADKTNDHSKYKCEFLCKQAMGKLSSRPCLDANNEEVTVQMDPTAIRECRDTYCSGRKCGCENPMCIAKAKLQCHAGRSLCMSNDEPEFLDKTFQASPDPLDCVGGDTIKKFVSGLEAEMSRPQGLKWYTNLFYSNLRCDIDLQPSANSGSAAVDVNELFTNIQVRVDEMKLTGSIKPGSFIEVVVTPGARGQAPEKVFRSTGLGGKNAKESDVKSGLVDQAKDKFNEAFGFVDDDSTPALELIQESASAGPTTEIVKGRRRVATTTPVNRAIVDVYVVRGTYKGFGRAVVHWSDLTENCSAEYPCKKGDLQVKLYEVKGKGKLKDLAEVVAPVSKMLGIVSDSEDMQAHMDTPLASLGDLGVVDVTVVLSRPTFDPKSTLKFLWNPSERPAVVVAAQSPEAAGKLVGPLSRKGTDTSALQLAVTDQVAVLMNVETTVRDKDKTPVTCAAEVEDPTAPNINPERYGVTENGRFYYAPAEGDVEVTAARFGHVAFRVTCECSALASQVQAVIKVKVYENRDAMSELAPRARMISPRTRLNLLKKKMKESSESQAEASIETPQ